MASFGLFCSLLGLLRSLQVSTSLFWALFRSLEEVYLRSLCGLFRSLLVSSGLSSVSLWVCSGLLRSFLASLLFGTLQVSSWSLFVSLDLFRSAHLSLGLFRSLWVVCSGIF